MKKLNLTFNDSDRFIHLLLCLNCKSTLTTHCKVALKTKSYFLSRETCENTADVIRNATALLTVLISILINAQKKSQMLFLINLCK